MNSVIKRLAYETIELIATIILASLIVFGIMYAITYALVAAIDW